MTTINTQTTPTSKGPYIFYFGCSKNEDRSVVAAAAATQQAKDDGFSHVYVFKSRGIYSVNGWGHPASKKAVEMCAGMNVDVSGHISAPFSAADVQEAERLFMMENALKLLITATMNTTKAVTAREYVGQDPNVPVTSATDAKGIAVEVYEQVKKNYPVALPKQA